MDNNKQNGEGVISPSPLVKEIMFSWSVYPNHSLCFPVRMAMSKEIIAEREQVIALDITERSHLLLDFQINLLSDILIKFPYMVDVDKLSDLLKLVKDEKRSANPEEIESLNTPFDNFQINLEKTLKENIKDCLSAKVEGNYKHTLVIEKVVSSFWAWATPRPTISVSEFLRINANSSMQTSES